MIPLWIPTELAKEYLIPRIDFTREGPMRAMGVLNDKMDLVGVAVIHDYQPDYGRCEVSAAADDPRWSSKGVLRFFFDFIYEELNCQMAYVSTAGDNPRGRRLFQMLGGTDVVFPRGRGRNVDEVITTVTDDQWKIFRDTRLKH